jgi:hypothetical protein
MRVRTYSFDMKRMMTVRPVEPAPPPTTAARVVPPGAAWHVMTIPAVPTADWPASLVLDHTIDRIVRDAISSGRSIQDVVARIIEIAERILPTATEAEIYKRVHAQLLANT